MKRILALILALCFILGGCAQGDPAQPSTSGGTQNAADITAPHGGGADAPAPAAAESFEKLALRLAALPELPEKPDETALWERMNGKSAEEQQKLWDEFSAQQTAYYDAVDALRGDGVDEAFTAAFAEYTLRTARQLAESENEQNVVYSPANLYLALCMLCETADGTSRAQLLDLLGLSSVEQARKAANSLYRSLYQSGGESKTLLANSIWLNEQFEFRQETVDRLAQDYFASTFRAPMGDKATDAAIHEWINENTNHLLENAANGLATKPETLMMLISTLYFKGTWADQFEQFATSEDTFVSAKGEEQKIDFMHKTDERGIYYRSDRFTVASLPFRDGTAMWFLLPDEGVSVQSLLPDLGNLSLAICGEAGTVQETPFGPIVATEGVAEIRWSVPKFDVDGSLDLIPALKALGVTDIFGASADFSPLTDFDAVVSAVQHAARVKVDEEGCEAAAFTAISMETTAFMPEQLPVVEMDLSRPFGFLITGADGLPLFVSIVNTMK